MEKTGLAAIAKYVLRDRQHLGCLRVRDRVISLERMFFDDEIRSSGELAPKKTRVAKAELEIATTLIGQFTGKFEPERYEDTYRDAPRDHQGEAEGRDDHGRARPGGRGAGGSAHRAQGVRRGGEAGTGSVRAKRPPARKRATRAKTKR